MSGDRARYALAGSRFAGLRWVAETGSTNADLLADARSGAPDGGVLVADHQTAGRGRLGRTWVAPPGGSLLFSVLLSPRTGPPLPSHDLHRVTTALGLAGLDAVRAVAGVDAGIKWPNDLVVATPDGERKLAGILAESVVDGPEVVAVVIGMGLNVAWEGRAPAELASIAVALDGVAAPVDREDLLVELLLAFERRLAGLATVEGRAALHADHLAGCVTLGREVQVEMAGGTVWGRAATIDDDGRLVVEPADGPPVAIAVGDVIHLR